MKLPRSFYRRPTISVAKDLLGSIIVRRIGSTQLRGTIVEVEAYLGKKDAASHAFRGITKRNEVMFGEGGFLYVYFTYGMHYCANVVTNKKGIGEAVLIRGVEPVAGKERMAKNRGYSPSEIHNPKKVINLTNGPAKFAQAFKITTIDSGADLRSNEIYIIAGKKIPASRIEASERIGISVARKKKWRFYIKENPWVSTK